MQYKILHFWCHQKCRILYCTRVYDKNKANSLKIDARQMAEQNNKLNNCVYKCGKNSTQDKCIKTCNDTIKLKPSVITQTPEEIDFYKRELLIKKYQANI